MVGVALVYNARLTKPHRIVEHIPVCGKCTLAAYTEPPGATIVIEAGDPLRYLTLGDVRTALLVVDETWVCTWGMRVLGGHALSHITVCTLKPLARHALYTASPPLTLRRVARAVLYGYSWRLLDEGSSLEKLAAKLAFSAGGGIAFIHAVIYSPKTASVVIAAGERLCIAHEGGLALASTGASTRCTLVESRVVTMKFARGVPRIEVHKADKLLR